MICTTASFFPVGLWRPVVNSLRYSAPYCPEVVSLHCEPFSWRLCVQVRVEGMSHSSVSSSTSSPAPSPSERPAGPPTPSSTPTPTQTPPQPEIVAIDREAASKGLMEWLRQNPSYSMDLPTFTHVRLLTASLWCCDLVLSVSRLLFSPPLVPVRGGTVAGFCGASQAEEASLQRPHQAGHQHSDGRGEGSCHPQRHRTPSKHTHQLISPSSSDAAACQY